MPDITFTQLGLTGTGVVVQTGPESFDKLETASDLPNFDADVEAVAPVQSVAGKTGAVTLAHEDITDFNAAAAAAAPVQSVNGQTGAVTAADLTLSNLSNLLTARTNLSVDYSFNNLAPVAASFTLTNPLATRTHFAFTAPGQFVTLPAMNAADSMGRSGNGRTFVLRNVGTLDGGIKDNAGNTLIPALPEGWEAWFCLGDNSTAAGLFAIYKLPSLNYQWLQSDVKDLTTDLAARLVKDNNLSDIPNNVAARMNLNVPSNSEALLKSGGTMSGNLILNADPTTALGAATKQYIDSGLGNKADLTLSNLSNYQTARRNIGLDVSYQSFTSASSFALTNPLATLIDVNFTIGTRTLTLPDFSEIANFLINGRQININCTGNTFSILNNSGSLIVPSLKNGQTLVIGLKSKATADGDLALRIFGSICSQDLGSIAGATFATAPVFSVGLTLSNATSGYTASTFDYFEDGISVSLTLGGAISNTSFTGIFRRIGNTRVEVSFPNVIDNLATSTTFLLISGIPARFKPISRFENGFAFIQKDGNNAGSYGIGFTQFDSGTGNLKVFADQSYSNFTAGNTVGLQSCSLTYGIT